MSSYWEILKNICRKFLPKAGPSFNLSNCSNCQIHISNSLSINNTALNFDPDKKILSINSALLGDAAPEVKELLRGAIKNNIPIMIPSEKQALSVLKAEEKENKDNLEFFKKVLWDSDFIIYRSCLYIKRSFDNGDMEDVAWRKRSLVGRFGQRAANMTNLCSSNYFDEYFKPLFETIESISPNHDEAVKLFQAIFDDIVKNLPWIVFVNSFMKKRDICAKIEGKFQFLEKYNKTEVFLHAVRGDNVKKVSKILADYARKGYIISENKKGSNIISASIKIPPQLSAPSNTSDDTKC